MIGRENRLDTALFGKHGPREGNACPLSVELVAIDTRFAIRSYDRSHVGGSSLGLS
jgi:hypothetical protein